MRRHSLLLVLACAVVAIGTTALATSAGAQSGGDTLVSIGSPPGPMSPDKQNEPALAVDAHATNVLVAGANDEIDIEPCSAGDPTTCPFTQGVGVSGVYFSLDSGDHWVQPDYTGWTARDCFGPEDCIPHGGEIGTLPWYFENGLVSDGDPAVAFGPRPGPNGFHWANGSRLYYANLTSNFSANRSDQAFKGFEAIAVSRTDDVEAAAAGDKNAWCIGARPKGCAPVIVSKQNAALFADKEQIWADNVENSRYFGHVYVCYAGFRGVPGASQPLFVSTSTDGGETWAQQQVTPAASNASSPHGFGRSGCSIRTDSHGVVYVFANQFAAGTPGAGAHILVQSFDGGRTWTHPRALFTAYDTCNFIELSIGRCVEDGIGGARNDLASAPSVDIANGAPFGLDATDAILDSWVDGRDGLNNEHVMAAFSMDHGLTWTTVGPLEDRTGAASERGYYAAPALSPNGTDAWLVYNAFTTPFRNNTTDPRGLIGAVKHADITNGTLGAFGSVHKGATGDPRGSSQNNLVAEFLGDYVYAVATRTFGAAVWNDVRNAAPCDAVNAYRQAAHDYSTATGIPLGGPEEPRGEADTKDAPKSAPPPPSQPDVTTCPDTFGNSDIYGGSYADPTP